MIARSDICARIVSLLLLGATVAACGGEATGRGGSASGASGKADDVDDGTGGEDTGGLDPAEHRAAVEHCEALADHARDHTSPARLDAVRTLESDRLDCLVAADDAVVDAIERTLEELAAATAGATAERFEQQRTADTNLCSLLTEASDVALDKDASVRSMMCMAAAELGLADRIDAFAELGVVPLILSAQRDTYATCYETHDLDLETAPGVDPVAEQLDATLILADCIDAEVRSQRDDLADRIVASFPGRYLDDVVVEIDRIFDDRHEASIAVCETLAQAGQNAGEDAQLLDEAECHVAVAEHLGTLVAATAYGDADETQGGSTSGAGTTGAATGTTGG